jgi:hypothetical protein
MWCHGTFNAVVAGSSPARLTATTKTKICNLGKDLVRTFRLVLCPACVPGALFVHHVYDCARVLCF